MARRIRITVSYDGTEFHGWQVQPGLETIQGTLEAILGGIEGFPVHVAGSGRTDAGVHARAQVAAFSMENPIPAENLQRAMNRLLPPAIRVTEAVETQAGFHPRFDAIAKTYRYRLWRAPICPPFEWRYVHHYPYPLDEEEMALAAKRFEGEHDFTVFAAADEKDAEGRSRTRRIFDSRLERCGDRLDYTVRGSGFLKHMVRNMVGTLLEAGRGNIDFRRGLPEKCGPTAPAKGLMLMQVEYPSREGAA